MVDQEMAKKEKRLSRNFTIQSRFIKSIKPVLNTSPNPEESTNATFQATNIIGAFNSLLAIFLSFVILH